MVVEERIIVSDGVVTEDNDDIVGSILEYFNWYSTSDWSFSLATIGGGAIYLRSILEPQTVHCFTIFTNSGTEAPWIWIQHSEYIQAKVSGPALQSANVKYSQFYKNHTVNTS